MSTSGRQRRVVVWLRRALRVRDNMPLWAALADADEVIPVVCVRDEAPYRRDTPRVRFMRSALAGLDEELRLRGSHLFVRVGTPATEIPAVAAQVNADAVYAVKVYDRPTRERDEKIAKGLRHEGRELRTFKDVVAFEEQEIVTAGGSPYRVFTPYKGAWLDRHHDIPGPLPAPRKLKSPPVSYPTIRLSDAPGFAPMPPAGGEPEALRRLKQFMRAGAATYADNRDIPAVDGTSRLSHHLAAGTISIRTVLAKVIEARQEAGRKERNQIDTYLAELIWREFYYSILANFPFVTDRAFRDEFVTLPWHENRRHFAAWCEGTTGYPIVDAAMRQLATEGWMHNRCRMITASFLTKDLHIDWRRGERYFFERLVDADIASNNGGWQWTAGTGTDASPWFRIFNPVLQGEKFDPDGSYVRRYVPELARVPAAAIHKPWTLSAADQRAHGCVIGKHYPTRVVDHVAERAVTLALYGRTGKAPARGESR